jgi:DNA invertase Pin-like site-specific DNA recombinase
VEPARWEGYYGIQTSSPIRQSFYSRSDHCQSAFRPQAVLFSPKLAIIGEFIDQGISGSKDNRPALKRLMDFARKRKIDIILVWKLDRFGRSVNLLVNSLEELRTLGIDFVSFTESLDTTSPQGRLVFNVMASIAEFERCLIVERVVAGLRRARAQGKAIGRPKAMIDRAKATLLASQGHSHRAIARSLGVSRMTVSRTLSQKPPWQIGITHRQHPSLIFGCHLIGP